MNLSEMDTIKMPLWGIYTPMLETESEADEVLFLLELVHRVHEKQAKSPVQESGQS